MVVVLAVVSVICLGAVGILARAAATDAVAVFNFTAWGIPIVGVVAILLIVAAGTHVGRKMSEKASEAEPREEAESEQETNPSVQMFLNRGRMMAEVLSAEQIFSQAPQPFEFEENLRVAEDDLLALSEKFGGGQVDLSIGGIEGNAPAVQESLRAIQESLRAVHETRLAHERWRAAQVFWAQILLSKAREANPPIESYDELTVADITERLADLSTEALERIRDYDRRHTRHPLPSRQGLASLVCV